MSKINIPAGYSLVSAEAYGQRYHSLVAPDGKVIENAYEQGAPAMFAFLSALAAAPTPPVDAVLGEPVAPSEPMYLVMAGGDGFTSRIVPASKLDDAYLLTQWFDLESIDPESRADALAHFHDDDEWTHTDVSGGGERLQFNLNLEDGWVNVIRLFDTTPLAAPVASRAVQAEPVASGSNIKGLTERALTEARHLFDLSENAEDMVHLSRAIHALEDEANRLAAQAAPTAPAATTAFRRTDMIATPTPSPSEAMRLAEEAKQLGDTMARSCASIARARGGLGSLDLTEACDVHRLAQVEFRAAIDSLRDLAALASTQAATPAPQATGTLSENLSTMKCPHCKGTGLNCIACGSVGIIAALSPAKREAEPVGEIVGTEKRGFALITIVRWEPGFNRTKIGTLLYAHAAPTTPGAEVES